MPIEEKELTKGTENRNPLPREEHQDREESTPNAAESREDPTGLDNVGVSHQ